MARHKLIILGHGRHGKDTVAEILRDDYGFSFESSSYACAEHVMMPYFESQDIHYGSVDECYADRHTGDNRTVWYDQISKFNEDPTRLIRLIFDAGHNIYVGMRSAREFEAAKEYADAVIWVDGYGRTGYLEPRKSFDIDYDPKTMKLIENNGTLDELKLAVKAFMVDLLAK